MFTNKFSLTNVNHIFDGLENQERESFSDCRCVMHYAANLQKMASRKYCDQVKAFYELIPSQPFIINPFILN